MPKDKPFRSILLTPAAVLLCLFTMANPSGAAEQGPDGSCALASTNSPAGAACTSPHAPSDAMRPYCHVPQHISSEAQAWLMGASAKAVSQEAFQRPDVVKGLREATLDATAPLRAAALEMLQDIQNSTIEGVSVSFATPKSYSKGRTSQQDAPGEAADAGGILVYFPGGAYYRGGCYAHGWAAAGGVAAAAGLKILCVNYRLAPEHPFPAGLEDALAVYRHVIGQLHYKPENVALLGDSAGGGLCMALLQQLIRDKLPLPSAAVLFAPWVDLTGAGDSVTTLTAVDPMLQHELNLKGAALAYVAGKEELLADPLVSPLFAAYDDAQAYPPILIQVGLRDSLLSSSAMLYRKLRDGGNEYVVFSPFEGMWHVFQAALVPEAQAASREAAMFLVKHLGSHASSAADSER